MLLQGSVRNKCRRNTEAVASLSNRIPLPLLPPFLGPDNKKHGGFAGNSSLTQPQRLAYMNLVLQLCNITVLRKRNGPSATVGWCALHQHTGHWGGTDVSSLGLWADEERVGTGENCLWSWPKVYPPNWEESGEGSDAWLLGAQCQPRAPASTGQYWE